MNIQYEPPRAIFRNEVITSKVPGGHKFLEVGAGRLLLSTSLLAKYDHGLAIDLNSELKRYHSDLSSEKKEKLKVKVDDFFILKKELYDLVVFCEVLEHIEDDLLFLKHAKKYLSDNGMLVFSVPSRMKYWSIHDEVAGHFRRYEKKELDVLLPKAGFDNYEILSYGFPFTNILWLLRVGLAHITQRDALNKNMQERTERSGLNGNFGFETWLKYLSNKTVLRPLTMFSSLFNSVDWGEGYIVIAEN